MAQLCIYELTKRNMSKHRENTNQPPSFVVSAKSMFQLVSAGDIIGRVRYRSIGFYRYCGIIITR